MDLGTTIDPNAVEPARQDFELLPDGEYIAQIICNDVQHTKAGTGLILLLTWEIVEGDFTNRKIWQNINYQNDSAQAQAIGQGQIKNICDAIGYTDHVSDADVLMFIPCRVRVGKNKKQEGYEQRNEIKAVKPYAAPPPATKSAAQQQAQAAAPKAAPAAGNKPAPAKRSTAAPAGVGARPWNRAAPARQDVDDEIPF